MFGILGNNARNLLYIKKFNDKKAIRLANNKLETKNFLGERGIPFAKTYGIISNRNELYDFDFSYLPKRNFVIKPNQGSKGNGIYIVKHLEEKNESFKQEKEDKQLSRLEKLYNNISIPHIEYNDKPDLYSINSNEISDSDFRIKLLDILDGKYSMNLGNDKIIVEEKLIPGELFKDFCEYGLADIRVIVFNLIPIATMIRVPTKYSHGKANLAQGGLGLGIEVGSGKISSMLRKNKIYTNKFPEEFEHFFGKKIPYWNDILFLSSKAQYFVNLGYLALDWVITNDGPKLLEINARAGLEVQNVTDTRLAKVLAKIEDLKVTDPEKGVEIAKSLFAREHSNLIRNNKILYLSQYGKLILRNKEDEEKIDIEVFVNLDKSNNYISQTLYTKIKENKSDNLIDLFDNDIILKKLKWTPLDTIPENKIILGKKTAEDFLIKASHKVLETINIFTNKSYLPVEDVEIKRIDSQLARINRKLTLSSKLRPINYFNELDNFITRNGKYNPLFKYKEIKEDKLHQTADELKKLQDKTSKITSPIKTLFLEKEDELFNKLKLIQAYSHQDFDQISSYNEKLFGGFNEELLTLSREKVYSQEDNKQHLLGDALKLSEIEQIIEKYLAERKIFGVDIVFSYSNLSRISVVMGKEIKISISKHGIFREKELLSILAHEIDTHLVRHLNGIKSGFHILKSGTGYYLKDEEGLAIYNASKFLPEGYEKTSIYTKYMLCKEGEKLDFKRLFELITFLNPEKEKERNFKGVLRLKKGIQNTSIINNGTIFQKDKIYLDGYTKIEEFIAAGNTLDKMYKGKIKIEDLDFISN